MDQDTDAVNPRIDIDCSEYASFKHALASTSRLNPKRDLEDMVAKSLLVAKGSGCGAHYELPAKWLGNGSNGSADGEHGGNGS